MREQDTITWNFQGGVFTVSDYGKEFGLRRDKDIGQLVLRSPQSMGIIGSDTLQELPKQLRRQLGVLEVDDMAAAFMLASKEAKADQLRYKIATGVGIRIATSYPNKLGEIAQDRGFELDEILCLKGSVESAQDDDPTIDGILDIVDSGKTLQDNGLLVVKAGLGKISLVAIWDSQGD